MIVREAPGDPRNGSAKTTECDAGNPAIQTRFPAFAARSSKIQYNGRKCRSCSPVRLYTTSCPDSGYLQPTKEWVQDFKAQTTDEPVRVEVNV